MNKIFPEIKVERVYSLVRFNNRELKLVYKIEEYQKIPLHKIDKLKKQGMKTKIFRAKIDDNNFMACHYQQYSMKIVPLKYRMRIINKILESVIDDKNTRLIDKIEDKWYNLNAHKTSKANLEDSECLLLERLADYYMGGLEGGGILTRDLSRAIHNKEIVTISGMANTDNEGNMLEHRTTNTSKRKWEFKQLQKKEWEETMENLPKKWKNSRTHKHSLIYSHIPEKKDEKTYWATGESFFPKEGITIERLINPNMSYESNWYLVNTKNIFKDNMGAKFKIKDSVKEYSPSEKDNEKFSMDKILVIQQERKKYYFNQNLDELSEDDIEKI